MERFTPIRSILKEQDDGSIQSNDAKQHEIEGGIYLRADLLAAMCKHVGKQFGDTSLTTALKQSGIAAKYRHPMAGKSNGRSGEKRNSKCARLDQRLTAVEEFLKANGFTMSETK